MAEISPTPASVVPGANADFYRGIAGGTITAGMPVYLDATTQRLYQADANASLETAELKGIATHAASAEQPLKIQTAGDITIGAAVVLSTIYILGAAGHLAPAADLASGWYCSIAGVAVSATVIRLNIFNSRAQKA